MAQQNLRLVPVFILGAEFMGDLDDATNIVRTDPFEERDGNAVSTCKLESLCFQLSHTSSDLHSCVHSGVSDLLAVFFPSRVEAHQASNQHCQEKLSANSLDDGQTARYIAARQDVAITEH